MSISNTRFSRLAQVIEARFSAGVWSASSAERGFLRLPRLAGVTIERYLLLGANTPWNRVRFTRGGKKLLGAAAGVGIGILQFVVSTLIAAVFLMSADGAGTSLRRLANRLAPQQGEDLLDMSVSTIRSVAVGVIGIAFIQALLGGLGMMFVGVPAAVLLAIVILVLAIAQLPPILVLGPVAFYVFSSESTTIAVIFLIWSILVSWCDMVLKPLLLGRGVDVPMLVILLGAIGGMLMSGIVGLFIGAIILAVGYKLYGAWLAWEEPVNDAPLIADEPGRSDG